VRQGDGVRNAQPSYGLFPEIKPDSRGFFSGDASAFFNDYFRDIGVKVDKTVNLRTIQPAARPYQGDNDWALRHIA
jgi:hypothetical protein